MRLYMRGTRRAALASFKSEAGEARFENLLTENRETLQTVYDGLQSGDFSLAYMRDGDRLIVLHRTGRGLQASHFWTRNGRTEATYHATIDSVRKLEDDIGCCSGYVNIRRATQ
ncbi:MAG: hypothetical protein J6X53_00140 [Abditibacteriota bacterium]|nr:hypothetical protein [Abditibacteriota bacterium]